MAVRLGNWRKTPPFDQARSGDAGCTAASARSAASGGGVHGMTALLARRPRHRQTDPAQRNGRRPPVLAELSPSDVHEKIGERGCLHQQKRTSHPNQAFDPVQIERLDGTAQSLLTLLQCFQRGSIVFFACLAFSIQPALGICELLAHLAQTIAKFCVGLTQCRIQRVTALRGQVFLEGYLATQLNHLAGMFCFQNAQPFLDAFELAC